MARVAIKDVAKMAQVSRTTASMALNDYENIAPQTKERVLRCARSLGYLPQHRKRSQARARKAADAGAMVFIVCGRQSFDANPYYGAIVSGAMQVAKEAQRKMVVCHWSPGEMHNMAAPKELSETSVTGAILTGWCDPAALECLRRSGLPVILADTNIFHAECDYVGPDNEAAVRLAFRHLRKLGHERIAALTGSLEHADWRRKQRAFASLATEERLPATTLALPSGGNDALWRAIQAEAPDATAVLATWDDAALSLLSALHASGVRCPADVSVIGIDGAAAGESSGPPLTTVNTNQRGIGELAALQLLTRIAHPHAPIVSLMPRAHLIERASCAPPSA